MKKLVSLLLALAMVPGLAGCGSVYSNYREMEELLAESEGRLSEQLREKQR